MWPRELVEFFITKYQKHENLYNTSHPHYGDRVKRSNSIFSICKDLKEMDKDVTEEAIKKKIHALRSQYLKEVRELDNSKQSAIDAEDLYEPKLWCFSQLEFLRPHCTTRKADTNICGSSNDSFKSLPKKKKVFEEKEDIADVFDAFEESGNDLSVLAQGWSSQYAELSKQQKVFARKIISDILFHGCLDNLRESTVREIHNILEAVGEEIYDPLHSDE